MNTQVIWTTLAALCISVAAQAEEWKAQAFDRNAIRFYAGEKEAFDLDVAVQGGPRGSKAKMDAVPTVRDGVRVFEDQVDFIAGPMGKKATVATADLRVETRQTGADGLEIQISAKGGNSKLPGRFGLAWRPREWLGGYGVATDAAGKDVRFDLPTPKEEDGNLGAIASGAGVTESSGIVVHKDIAAIAIHPAKGEPVKLTFDSLVELSSSPVSLEVLLTAAAGKIKVGTPGKLQFVAANPWVDTARWFPMQCDNDPAQPSLAGQVFRPNGTMIGKFRTPQVAANCCFGGPTGRELLITATTSVWLVALR